MVCLYFSAGLLIGYVYLVSQLTFILCTITINSKKMRDDEMKALGLDVTWARPEWMCISVMPVPPLHVRPSVVMGGGAQSSEDDLTHQLVNIVKSNIALKTAIKNGEPNIIVEQFEQALQHNCAAFMNNELRGMPQVTQRSGRPLKTLAQRLKAKEGRIRGNLMGKRVDFSARSVLIHGGHLLRSRNDR